MWFGALRPLLCFYEDHYQQIMQQLEDAKADERRRSFFLFRRAASSRV
jgi:hypothetical protein